MKTTAIQIVPYAERNGVVVAQPEGPNDHTIGWAVYERKIDGTVEWFADAGNDIDAKFIARARAQYYRVSIEPLSWAV